MITLTNHYLKAQISPDGAELKSLIFLPTGKEIIWQANPGIWARSAPLLFPIVGKLKNDSHKWNGLIYNMSQHGFARDSAFHVGQMNETAAIFSLSESEQTLSKYPYDFALKVSFQLKGNSISQSIEVENTGENDMPFSIGFHPGFNIFGAFSDYQILFEKPEKSDLLELKGGLIAGVAHKNYLDQSQELLLEDDIFNNDALIFKGLHSNFSKLKKQDGSHELTIEHPGFPYLGIWSKPDAAFVCIEPWYGLADSVNSDGNLFNKEGIVVLNPGKKFSCAITIHVNNAF